MNKEHILQIAGAAIKDIREVSEGVYRGELNLSEENPSGICYIDTNQNISSAEFSDYQEKLIADDYFNHPGSLQWNYYLFLLQDSVNKELRDNIEKNDKYARKYVFTENDFADFFKLEKSAGGATINVVGQWKKELDAVGLYQVSTKAAVNKSVDDFFKKEKNPPVIPPVVSVPAVEKWKNISHLKLHNTYRPYAIKQRDYKFGSVNLLRGSNGTGKTSLLEAIELVACGKSFRNELPKEVDGCIEAAINGGTLLTEICTPSDNKKYRHRDLVWYNSEYKTNSDAHISFNRFNFFNTDAATRFSTSSIEQEVKKALFNLILGPEYTYIFERLRSFITAVRPRYNKLHDELDNAKRNSAAHSITINQLSVSRNLGQLKENLSQNISQLKFTRQFDIDSDIAVLEKTCNELSTSISTISSGKQNSATSIADLEKQKTELKRQKAIYEDFMTSLRGINSEITDQQTKLQEITINKQVLQDAEKYYTDERSFSIAGLSVNRGANDTALRTISQLKKTIGTLSLEQFNETENLQDVTRKINQSAAESAVALLQVDKQIEESAEQLDKLTRLITQIKNLGKQYIEADDNAEVCPLCDSKFDSKVLAERVKAERITQTQPIGNFQDLLKERRALTATIESFNKKSQEYSILQVACASISDQNPQLLSPFILANEIKKVLETERTLLKTKNLLDGLSAWAVSQNMSENELNSLTGKIPEIFGAEYPFLYRNKEKFSTKLKELEKAVLDGNNAIGSATQNKFKVIREFKIALSLSPETEYKSSEIQGMFSNEEKKLATIERAFEKIKDLVIIEKDTVVQEVIPVIMLLRANIESLQKAMSNDAELVRVKKELELADNFIKNNTANYKRIKNGYSVLEKLAGDEASQQLDKFFNQNLVEISDIFRTIHAPKEFTGISYKQQELFIVTENNSLRKISQISTGQRAALTISIFISLNRKLTNGPDIIIFDDPVAHVDDMNVLSFLDFLRFFMLKEGKQIFIATANERFAELVQKKFAFLENDFTQFIMER
jgi:DNA repair exonuclease SbcCD ATPase subunit